MYVWMDVDVCICVSVYNINNRFENQIVLQETTGFQQHRRKDCMDFASDEIRLAVL